LEHAEAPSQARAEEQPQQRAQHRQGGAGLERAPEPQRQHSQVRPAPDRRQDRLVAEWAT